MAACLAWKKTAPAARLSAGHAEEAVAACGPVARFVAFHMLSLALGAWYETSSTISYHTVFECRGSSTKELAGIVELLLYSDIRDIPRQWDC